MNMLLTPDVQIIENRFYEQFRQNEHRFNYYDGYRNNCARIVKKFLATSGLKVDHITAWADTVRKIGPVQFNSALVQPGDVVAMGRPGDTHHVGVYLGRSLVLHQSAARGYKVGAFPDLAAFVNSRHGFYYVRPSYENQKILEYQFYIAPEVA